MADVTATSAALPSYQYRLDDAYVRTAVARMQSFPRSLRELPSPKVLVASLLVVGIAAAYWIAGAWLEPLVLVSALVGFHVVLRRRAPLVFRSSPQYGAVLHCTLTTSGLHTWHPTAEGTTFWNFYARARGFQDGILLFPAGGGAVWLPDSALVQGTREQAEILLAANLPGFESRHNGG